MSRITKVKPRFCLSLPYFVKCHSLNVSSTVVVWFHSREATDCQGRISWSRSLACVMAPWGSYGRCACGHGLAGDVECLHLQHEGSWNWGNVRTQSPSTVHLLFCLGESMQRIYRWIYWGMWSILWVSLTTHLNRKWAASTLVLVKKMQTFTF